MLYIITALRAEASPFITHYSLKRISGIKRHEVYSDVSGSVMLLITRPGKIPAAVALTELLAAYPPSPHDYLANIGVCGSLEPTSEAPAVFMCNRILDHDIGKYCYPDLLFWHPFAEAAIETCSIPADGSFPLTEHFADMEASAIFQAGSSFLSPHQMGFLKLPSDMLMPDTVTPALITGIIEAALADITGWLDTFANNSCRADGSRGTAPSALSGFSDNELSLMEDISARLNLSVTMREELIRLFIYGKLIGKDLSEIAVPCAEGRITNQKRTILFEQLRKQFL